MVTKSVEHLVNENFVYAKVLDYFGVKFYEERNKPLSQVCEENGINPDHLIKVLEKSQSRKSSEYLNLRDYPIRLIVEYLKHSHQIFIKDNLPYLLKKIDELDSDHANEKAHDLKVVLPMFVEDFIHHIYEEEDRFFTYVCELENALKKQKVDARFLSTIDTFSIQEFALHHNDSDNEMKGIRGITDHYDTEAIKDPRLAVVIKELKKFDHELTLHANIENDILFPKALKLEKQVRAMLAQKTGLN